MPVQHGSERTARGECANYSGSPPPIATAGANQTINEATTAVEQTVKAWATNIADGPSDPAGQTLAFNVSTDNNALFAPGGQPAIDAAGDLTYTPAANVFGTANVTVSLSDGGGTANGGQNTSPAQTFAIVVNFVNQAPSFAVSSTTAQANPTVDEFDPRLTGAVAT